MSGSVAYRVAKCLLVSCGNSQRQGRTGSAQRGSADSDGTGGQCFSYFLPQRIPYSAVCRRTALGIRRHHCTTGHNPARGNGSFLVDIRSCNIDMMRTGRIPGSHRHRPSTGTCTTSAGSLSPSFYCHASSGTPDVRRNAYILLAARYISPSAESDVGP